MSTDPETIAVYDANSQSYAKRRDGITEPGLPAFIAALPEGAQVLDIGCGPGDSAARFLAAGLSVDAVDASPGMVAEARARGVPARLGSYDEIDATARYDGIWSSYSLLHVPRDEVPDTLARLHRALKPGGLLHLGLKLGAGTKRDPIGRRYTYFTEDELDRLLGAAGFTPFARETSRGTGLDGQPYEGIWIHARG